MWVEPWKKEGRKHTHTQSIMSLPYIFHVLLPHVYYAFCHFAIALFIVFSMLACTSFLMYPNNFFPSAFQPHFLPASCNDILLPISRAQHLTQLSYLYRFICFHLKWKDDESILFFIKRCARTHVQLSSYFFLRVCLCVAFSFVDCLCIYWCKREMWFYLFYCRCMLVCTMPLKNNLIEWLT